MKFEKNIFKKKVMLLFAVLMLSTLLIQISAAKIVYDDGVAYEVWGKEDYFGKRWSISTPTPTPTPYPPTPEYSVLGPIVNPAGIAVDEITFGRTTLWLSDGFSGMIYNFDPHSSMVLKRFNGPSGTLRDLEWDNVYLWATSWEPRMIYQMDTNGNVLSSFEPPFTGRPNGITRQYRYLWIGEEGTGKLYKVDAYTHEVVSTIQVVLENQNHNPRGIAFDSNRNLVYVAIQTQGEIRIFSDNGLWLHTIASPLTSSPWALQSVAYQANGWDRFIWATGGDMRIYKIRVI